MATHTHIGMPCKICGFPLEGLEANKFVFAEQKATANITLRSLSEDLNEDEKLMQFIEWYWREVDGKPYDISSREVVRCYREK